MIHFIISDNEYLAQSESNKLIQSKEDVSIINWNSKEIDKLIDESNSYSQFSNEKIIMLKNPSFLFRKTPKEIEDKLNLWMKSNIDAKIIIIATEKIDKRLKITKTLIEISDCIEIETKDEVITDIIKNHAKKNNIKIEREIIEILKFNFDSHIQIIISEMDKIKIAKSKNIDDEIEINQDDISKFSYKTSENNVFDLAGKILNNKKKDSYELYVDLIQGGLDNVALNTILYNQFSLIYKIKLLKSMYLSDSEIAKELAINSYRIKYALINSKGSNKDIIRNKMIKIIENDYKMKTGKLNSDIEIISILF